MYKSPYSTMSDKKLPFPLPPRLYVNVCGSSPALFSNGYRRSLSESEPEPDPAPHTPYNRVLGLICSYNYGHIDPLTLILNEYLYMCEGGWDPVIALFTTERWTSKIKRLYADKLYCYRTNSSVEIRHMVFP